MVVTRKSSAGLSTSRSSSSTAVSKMNKGKAPQTPGGSDEDEKIPQNGSLPPSTPTKLDHSGPQFSDDVVFASSPSPKKSPKRKDKGKAKRKEKPTRRASSSLVDLLARMFLLFFLIYSLSVCPSDKELDSPVCRALSEYRRLVLEPVIIRPFQNALHHPSVAPYVEQVKPHVNTVIGSVTPLVTRTKVEWNSRVVPLWNQHVTPQVEKHISPQLAWLDVTTKPYRETVSNTYERVAGPYLSLAQQSARKVRPYLLLTAAKAYDSYQLAKPHLSSAACILGRVPPLFSQYVVVPLSSARRQFVDPHVATIIDKVKELSSGKPIAVSSDTEDAEHSNGEITTSQLSKASDKTEEIELPLVPEPTEDPSASETKSEPGANISASAYLGEEIPESVPGATYSPVPSDNAVNEEDADDIAPPPEPEPEPEVESTPESSKPLVTRSVYETAVVTSYETVIETSTKLEVVSSVVQEVVTEHLESPFTPAETFTLLDNISSALESIVEAAEESNSINQESSAVSPASPTPSVLNESDPDLEAFYADLGINDDDLEKLDFASESEQLGETPQPETPEVSEEEKAEADRLKAIEVAEKRRDITTRHAQWEAELEQEIKDQKKALRKALVALRKAAAGDLKTSDAIRSEVEKLNTEAEKALKGIEAYFKKLAKESKSKEESVKLWDRVLLKVEDKYAERVTVVETIANNWYTDVIRRELGEVEKAANLVKDLSERGQADIGFDYVWLDDVTPQDWVRYHALADKYKQFINQANSIQNGSHPSPPINPVLNAMDDLQSEVNDITVGFETRLRRIKREGERAFALDRAKEISRLDGDDTDDDASETGESADSEPVMSILPVPDANSNVGKSEEEVLQDVSNAILGRSEGEVEDALARAEKVANPTDVPVDVGISEKSDEEDVKIVHEEL